MAPLILIADDDEDILKMLSAYLTKKGFEIKIAKDGYQAIEQANVLKPSLMILDFYMPAAPGNIVYERLKQSYNTANIPVIFLTGKPLELLKSGLKDYQYVRFFRKPVDLQKLEETIREILGCFVEREEGKAVPCTKQNFSTASKDATCIPKILIIDDEPDTLKLISNELQYIGYEVFISPTGSNGMDILRKQTIDLVLLDVMLGKENGFEICRAIRKEFENRIPVIMVTAKTGTESIVLGFEAGADEYVAKPFKIQELSARIKSMLRLKYALDELRELNAFKNELLTMTSHDFKNSLAAIRGYAELLAESEKSSISSDKQKKMCAAIIEMSNSMIGLIKRFLDRAWLESSEIKVKKSNINPVNLVQSLIQQSNSLALNKQIDLFYVNLLPEGYGINLDMDLVQEIVLNLLNNALKWTPEKGKVQVILQSSDGYFKLSVKDTGPGIPVEEQKDIFERFRKSVSFKTKGSGYGLGIVKKFAELHNGRVELQSMPGQGADFTVCLPEN